MIDPLETSNLVRELRQRLGLTQEEFASHLGVTFSTINRWENKKSRPSKMALQLLQGKARELGDVDLLNRFL
ncbi:MAG: helix-turn-helix domain-containing protein [Leptolyngbya sp. UWPOB_LEPTO1]|uniref:helix-turn-helix domain-containing protein n=1 Tax=Leptolyngbya sp. UWPOB_LEPTO1 TaxID=2815653 RepID=UPI001AC84CF1|nr:helix-turn-helix domain-containing protein [Leptolyngbya sp. UWPOB_LEPTO1]MBN8561068.1 helix-turn-helix domain-containing protein [Leptolyngbya sp. UWPOB_LEPTO1]